MPSLKVRAPSVYSKKKALWFLVRHSLRYFTDISLELHCNYHF